MSPFPPFTFLLSLLLLGCGASAPEVDEPQKLARSTASLSSLADTVRELNARPRIERPGPRPGTLIIENGAPASVLIGRPRTQPGPSTRCVGSAEEVDAFVSSGRSRP